MSDCAEQFYNAWVAVNQGSPKKLLCTCMACGQSMEEGNEREGERSSDGIRFVQDEDAQDHTRTTKRNRNE